MLNKVSTLTPKHMQAFCDEVGHARCEIAIEDSKRVVVEVEQVQQHKIRLAIMEESLNERLSEDMMHELGKKNPDLAYLLDVLISLNAK